MPHYPEVMGWTPAGIFSCFIQLFEVRNSPENDGHWEENRVEEQDPLPGVPGGPFLGIAATDERPVEHLQGPGRQDGPDGRPAPVGVVVVEEADDGPDEEAELDQRHSDVEENHSEVEPAVAVSIPTSTFTHFQFKIGFLHKEIFSDVVQTKASNATQRKIYFG